MREQLHAAEHDGVVHDIVEELEHRKEPALTPGNGSGNAPKGSVKSS